MTMLNTTARNFAYSSYAQSASQFQPRKNRFLASTGFSNLNSSMQMNKLPQLSRSFSSSKSTKLKLTTIEAGLSTISQQLQQLKLQTRESRRFCNFLKDDLGTGQLGILSLELTGQANKLEKSFKLAKKYDEDRCQILKKDCDALRVNTNNLKTMCNTLANKLDNLQNIMGIYSGKEKHKM